MTTILAHAADPQIRRMASSGGLTKAILAHLLEIGHVDGVVIARSGDGRRFKPEFIVTSDPKDVLTPLTNSVYWPVSPRQAILDLPAGGRYAATLLPCDAAWLVRIQSTGRLANVVFKIGLMCNATPNAEWTERLIASMDQRASRLRSLHYRGDGWPGTVVARGRDGTTRRNWVNAWEHNNTEQLLSAKCRACRHDNMVGMDMMVADPWMCPVQEIGDGRTMAHIASDQVLEVVESAKAAGKIVVEPVDDQFFHKQLANLVRVKRSRRLGPVAPTGAVDKPDGRKLRVGLVTPALYWGGAERWMLDLARQSTHAIEWTGVACVTKQFRDGTMASLFDQIMPVVEHGREAVQQVAAHADALVAWGAYDLGSLVEGFHGPVVFVGHGSGTFDRSAVTVAAPGATHHAAVARASLEPFRGVVPVKAVEVIHNGIDPQRCIQTVSRDDLRASLCLTDEEFVVGYVGRLVPEKNPVGLARAVCQLPKRFKAMFVGGGWDLNRQRQEITEYLGDRAIFVDRTEQVGNYYRAMDVFSLLSPREGFSMGMLEAMYCGTACVLTRVGVLPELERLVGKHWETVSTGPNCHREAAEAIARLAAMSPESRQQMVADCKAIVDQRFLASHMADRWIKYLTRIVAGWHAEKSGEKVA